MEQAPQKVLDIGCGKEKLSGAVGLDMVAVPGVDVVHDLDELPYPFPDSEFDCIRMSHVLEHVKDVVKVMEEIYRIIKPGGIVEIITPHYTDDTSWRDITHRWHFHSESFAYFDPGKSGKNYITAARFETVYSYVGLQNIGKVLGLEFLVNLINRSPSLRFLRKFWEKHLSYLIRGTTIHAKLKAVKASP